MKVRWEVMLLFFTFAFGAIAAEPIRLHEPHVVRGPLRELWLPGRELWSGPEKVAQASTVTIGAVKIPVDHLHGANDQDANRGLPFLQRFTLPQAVPAGRVDAIFTRNDGATAPFSVHVPPAELREKIICEFGEEELAEPITVPRGTTRDLKGKRYVAGPTFPIGKPLVVLMSGARVRNGILHVTADSRANRGITLESPSFGCRVDAVWIQNDKPAGIGLQVRAAEELLVYSVQVKAARCVDANPEDYCQRNIFYGCEFTAPRGSLDGQVGRGIGGKENLVVWCHWHDIDRGPTLSPQGAPLDRMTFFECTQRHTGISEGASEGTLFEAKKCPAGMGIFKGRQATIIPDNPADAAKTLVRGYFVSAFGERPRWARIDSIEKTDGKVWIVNLDASMETRTREGLINLAAEKVYFGNAVAELAMLRCQLLDGESGLFFWSAGLSNAVVGCEFRSLEAAVKVLDRQRGPTDTAFTINLLQRHNRYRGVANNLVILK